MKKLRLIEVPVKSSLHYINQAGCLRYMLKNEKGGLERSIAINPEEIGFRLENEKHLIVGYTEINDKKYIVIQNK